MNIAENVRNRREKAGMTQEELASKVAVGRVMICKIETGLKLPSIALCKELANVFGCTLDELTE